MAIPKTRLLRRAPPKQATLQLKSESANAEMKTLAADRLDLEPAVEMNCHPAIVRPYDRSFYLHPGLPPFAEDSLQSVQRQEQFKLYRHAQL